MRTIAMRRLMPFGLLMLLPACSYVGNPVDGMGGFLGDTMSVSSNPNQPPGDAPNMRRVMGETPATEPLLPEPGNVWPGPLPPEKTLSDLQRDAAVPDTMTRGSGTTAPAPTPVVPPLKAMPPMQTTGPAKPLSRVLLTPAGPATTSIGGNGIETYTLPDGRTGTVVNNGNGTATLIGTDGSTLVAPLPR